jgi:thymidylate synthase (FAD)
MREWRHIFKLRCAGASHPQIRQLMLPLLDRFKTEIAVLFDDLHLEYRSAIDYFNTTAALGPCS